MKSVELIGVAGLVAGLGGAGISHAQNVTMAVRHVAEGAFSGPTRLEIQRADRLLSVQLQNVTVRDALSSIARQSGVVVAIGEDVISSEKRVNVSVENKTAKEAVALVLAGTGLRGQWVGGEKVIVSRVVQVQGVIVGKVLHAKTKKPVRQATVSLESQSGDVITGPDGTFRLAVASGEHNLHIRALGFVKQVKRVHVSEQGTVTVDVMLEPSASVLDEVVVTGTVIETERRRITTPITVITAEDIEKRGIARIEELFRGEVPSVFAMDYGTANYSADRAGGLAYTRIYSRGSSLIRTEENPLKVYIDGAEVLEPSLLGTIDPNVIDRIEIITGPQAATIYGSGAVGGVMQIFTKKGSGQNSTDWDIGITYGLLQSNFSNALTPRHDDLVTLSGGSGPQFSYRATGSYRYTGQWRPYLWNKAYSTSVGLAHSRDRLNVDGSMQFGWLTNGTYKDEGVGGLGHLEMIESGQSFYFSGNPKARWLSQQISHATTANFSATLNYRMTPMWSHQLTLGRNQSGSAIEPSEPSYQEPVDSLWRTSRNSGANNNVNYNTSFVFRSNRFVALNLTVGVNGSKGESWRSEGCISGKDGGAFLDCSSVPLSPMRMSRSFRDANWGGFTRTSFTLFDALTFTTAIRANRNRKYGDKHKIDWTPSYSSAYTMELGHVTVKVMGSYGASTRAPGEGWREESWFRLSSFLDPVEALYRAANDYLTPEYSRGGQGGLEVYFGNRGSFTINRFDQKVSDQIEDIAIDTTFVLLTSGSIYKLPMRQYVNTGDVRQFGWETTGSLNLWAFAFSLTHSWNDSRVLRASRLPTGYSSRTIPTHFMNWSVSYSQGATSVTLRNNWTGAAWNSGSFASPIYQQGFQRIAAYIDTKNGFLFSGIYKPAYSRSHLTASHRLTPSSAFTLSISNLMNDFTSDLGSWDPTLGRTTSLGLKLRFNR